MIEKELTREEAQRGQIIGLDSIGPGWEPFLTELVNS